MIKDKYIKPLLSKEGQREVLFTHGLKAENIIEYLQSLSDDKISELGNALAWLYPSYILRAFLSDDKNNKYYDFASDFRKDYNISSKFTMKDKHLGISLVKELSLSRWLLMKVKEIIDRAINNEEILKNMDRIYLNKAYMFLNRIIIKEGNKLRFFFERNKIK